MPMDLFQDISNRDGHQKKQTALKTFERRRRPAAPEEPATPVSDAITPGSCSSSPSTVDSPSQPFATEALCSTAAAGLCKHGRRSSVLRAAALPGHQMFSSHSQTSRSLLLAKMSKARRKAYLAYTQQMAEYFAQVDQFELLEESPTTLSSRCAGESSAEPPMQSQKAQGATADTEPADGDSSTPDGATIASPGAPGSCSRSSVSRLQLGTLDCLSTIHSSMSALSLAASTPAGRQTPAAAAPPGDKAHQSAVCSQANSAAASSPNRLLPLLAASPPPSAAATSQQQQQQASQGAQQGTSSSSSRARCSLVSSTPAASQQADMQELLEQMHHMWLATTPYHIEEALQATTTTKQQQQQQDANHATADVLAEVLPLCEQQQLQKPKRKPGKTAAGDVVDREAERQQQEQQQLAEQHYQAWLQKQAEAAAAAEVEQLELAATAAAELTPLQQMLQACGQSVCVEDIPSMKEFLVDVVDLRDVVKIGEGTYGEAFKSGQVVLKFVPMEGSNLINGWPQKGAGDLLGEAVIALALTDLGQELDDTGAPHASYTDAFVQTHRVGVCQGPYPAAFIKAWRAWDKRHKSENDPIAGLPDQQLYAVFAMANCGRDLESYCLQGYEQVRSMMLQTALALAVAEEALAFEHRDLHWGNIMLSPAQETHITARLKGCSIRVHAVGIRVRLIDFTASRLQTPRGDVVFCDLEGEDGLFDGTKGKPQFETYRRMRKLTRKDWASSYPGTNVLWLLYLTELLLSSEKPVPGATAAQKRNLREFKKRLSGYNCCSDVIWDELFDGLWAAV